MHSDKQVAAARTIRVNIELLAVIVYGSWALAIAEMIRQRRASCMTSLTSVPMEPHYGPRGSRCHCCR